MIFQKKFFKPSFIVLCVLVLSLSILAQTVLTPGEKSKYTQYTQNEDIGLFLSELSFVSKELQVEVIGKSYGTRQYEPEDLYLCILTEEGIRRPEDLNRNRPTFLLVASQHGNEQSAKEAALKILRDLAVGELKPLLNHLNVLIIPQANPFGNRFDQRRNGQDLDLNRDHVKLEAPEVRALHRVFRVWLPEMTLDVHEKGDDYYRVSIGCVSNVNIHPSLQTFSRDTMLSEVEKALGEKEITFKEYLVTQRMGIDSSAGVTYRPEDSGSRESMMRYSTTDLNDGRNSFGIYETFSFIQEGASRHDIDTLEARSNWQYYGIRFLMDSAARHGEAILSSVRDLRGELMAKAKVYREDDLVHLSMLYAREKSQPTLTIRRFVRTASPARGVLMVDKKAGDTLTSADIAPLPSSAEYGVEEEVVLNWFPAVEPIKSVTRPLGYIVPAGLKDVVRNLFDHGIEVGIFTQDVYLEVETYQISDIIAAEYDYLPPQALEVEKKNIQAVVKKGDYFISCAQPASNLIPCLLEPESQYGLIRYWSFNLVPEKGGIFPFYRVVGQETLPVIPYMSWEK
jgi:hypothetical protein